MIFKPIRINKIKLINRIVVSPMCQYSARNGEPTNWHLNHLSKLLNSGAGLLMIESTAVSRNGRITHGDLCLSNRKQEKKFKELKIKLNKLSKIPLGIQISHAGRKASSFKPWIKYNAPLNKKNQSWQTYAPSAIRRDKNWPIPKALKKNQILKIIKDFKNTAIKAKNIGFDCLEIHMAHGYLLHQFISPISNKRNDEFGGSLNNRLNLPLQISQEIKKVWPKKKILGARITATDHLPNGIKINEAIYLVKKLEKIGFDYVCVSSGGILPKTNLKFRDSFRARLAKKIKKETNMIVRTSGLINNINQANSIIKKKCADIVAIGRKFINDPYWIIRKFPKYKRNLPKQYLSSF
jgi:2,4-dienoyl-CoA reductase-like NADH-dependent reductase (Old Yellow Enzyme family)